MAAPTFVDAGTGATDAGGAWTYTCQASGAAGRVFIVQILQDGTTSGAFTQDSASNIVNLAGITNLWTSIPGPNSDISWPVGVAEAARQFLFIGRATSTSAPTLSGGNSTSEDLYIRSYQFTDVNTGSTLSAVIENASAGSAFYEAGTGTTVSDRDVTTLGADRLALNFVAANDDVAIDAFTGEAGGDWVEAVAEYASASGTDGMLQLQTAAMASAGTISGGSDTIVSAAWGVVGFALIGTTPEGPPAFQPRHPQLNHSATAVLMGGIRRAWHRRHSGILVPDLWLPKGAIA